MRGRCWMQFVNAPGRLQGIGVVVILCFMIPASVAQSISVSGYVVDAETGERLSHANIFNIDAKSGTTTNDYGFFKLLSDIGWLNLSASYVGYSSDTLTIDVSSDTTITIPLHPRIGLLDGIAVAAERQVLWDNAHLLTPDNIAELPAIAGERDLLKVAQTLPGIRSGTEGTSGLYVRGGSPDQNLILLDGVPIYHAAHVFGFLSLFNPDAVQSVRILKGGFPARYGSRLSSVVDVDTREGSLNEAGARIGTSPVAARLLVEGPIRRKRASYLLSVRRTYLDALALMFLPNGGMKVGAYFYDLNGKVNFIISPDSRLYANAYAGRDRYYRHSSERINGFDEVSREGIGWSNYLATVKFTRVLSPSLFLELAALTTNYQLAVYDHERVIVNGKMELAGLRYESAIRDYGASGSLDIFANDDHSIRMGFQLTYHQFRPGAAHHPGDDSSIEDPPTHHAFEGAAYVEDEATIFQKWHANLGVRASSFSTGGRTYASIEPRASLSYSLTDRAAITTSVNVMQQYVHLLTSSGVGMPTDLWLPTTKSVRPQRALQTTLGYTFRSTETEARIEGSYKAMNGLLEYREGASFASSGQDWQRKITQGTGRYLGIEVFLRRQFENTTATVAYTLSQSSRRFSEIDDGEQFPFRYDRPHDVSLTISHQISERRSLTAFWTYGSGDAITIPKAWYFDPTSSLGGRVYSFFGSRGNYRTPAYHRLDFVYNIKYSWSWADGVLGLGMYNAYGRANPFYMFVDTDPANQFGPYSDVPALELKKMSIFRFVPIISLDLRL